MSLEDAVRSLIRQSPHADCEKQIAALERKLAVAKTEAEGYARAWKSAEETIAARDEEVAYLKEKLANEHGEHEGQCPLCVEEGQRQANREVERLRATLAKKNEALDFCERDWKLLGGHPVGCCCDFCSEIRGKHLEARKAGEE